MVAGCFCNAVVCNNLKQSKYIIYVIYAVRLRVHAMSLLGKRFFLQQLLGHKTFATDAAEGGGWSISIWCLATPQLPLCAIQSGRFNAIRCSAPSNPLRHADCRPWGNGGICLSQSRRQHHQCHHHQCHHHCNARITNAVTMNAITTNTFTSAMPPQS